MLFTFSLLDLDCFGLSSIDFSYTGVGWWSFVKYNNQFIGSLPLQNSEDISLLILKLCVTINVDYWAFKKAFE